MGPDWLNVVWTFCGGWLLNKMELCLDLRINTLDIEYGDKTESIFSTSWQTQMFYADIYYERRTRLCHLSLYTHSVRGASWARSTSPHSLQNWGLLSRNWKYSQYNFHIGPKWLAFKEVFYKTNITGWLSHASRLHVFTWRFLTC